MDKKHKNLIIVSLVRTVSVLIVCYCYFRYDDLNTIWNKENPIEYSIKSAEKKSSPPTHYGLVRIEYNQKEYELEILYKAFVKLKNNKEMPILYYEEERNIVFSELQIILFRNWAIVAGIVFLITFIPFGKISKKMEENSKACTKLAKTKISSTKK